MRLQSLEGRRRAGVGFADYWLFSVLSINFAISISKIFLSFFKRVL